MSYRFNGFTQKMEFDSTWDKIKYFSAVTVILVLMIAATIGFVLLSKVRFLVHL